MFNKSILMIFFISRIKSSNGYNSETVCLKNFKISQNSYNYATINNRQILIEIQRIEI